jgi:hypothetical protein
MSFSPPFIQPAVSRSALPSWSLGIGIGALVLSWVPVLGLLLGLVAVVFGAVALTKPMGKGKAAIGSALGVVALVINVIVLAALGTAGSGKVNAAATLPPATTAAAADPIVGTTEPVLETTLPVAETTAPPTVAPTTKKAAPPVVKTTTARPISAEEENAIRSARSYLEFQAFSRKGLIRQLSSDAGEGYSLKAATAAVDSLHINFNEQAYKSAKSYLEMSGFSRKGLIQQLESDAGEGFTHSQAVYGVTKAGL